MSRLDWPNALLGFLLGVSPWLFSVAINFVRYVLSPNRKKYRGDFYLYHLSLTTEKVREKRIRFGLSFTGRLRVVMPLDPVSHLAFEGRALKGHGSVTYLVLKGSHNHEHMMIVINDPLDPEFTVTSGVFSAVNMQSIPSAGGVLLSRSRMDFKDVRAYLEPCGRIKHGPVHPRLPHVDP